MLSWSFLAASVVILAVGVSLFFSKPVQLWYYHWRFVKTNASDLDEFRAREYLASALRKASGNGEAADQEVSSILSPVIEKLRYKNVPPQLADAIERLIMDCHSSPVDRLAIPQLIETLKNENSDIRLHIQETLATLCEMDFHATALPDTIAKCVPRKEDSAGDIADKVAAWNDWWNSATAASARK